MKHNAFLFGIIFFISSLFPLFQTKAQTTYSVPITLSISNEGLNRTVARQWSDPNFTKVWTGTVDELYYELHLEPQPIITLSTNLIKLRLNFWIKVHNNSTQQDIFTHKEYSVLTTLVIPPITISTNIIYAQYTGLHTDITNTLSDVDSRVRNEIEQKLAAINWMIYKGKIINIPSPPPLNKVSNALTWNITSSYSNTVTPERVLEITVTSTITASP